MRRWFLIYLIFFFNISQLFAQDNLLEIQASGNNLFLDHKVSAKESLYSLGRLYNVSPKELAAYNKLTITSGLSIGQNLKIPLTTSNFSQSDKMSANEVLVPVHYTMKAQETLFRLSQQFNKVSVDELKNWNNLPSDVLSIGTSLIIGFLKVNKDQSSLISRAYVPGIVAPIEKENASVVTVKQHDTKDISPKKIVVAKEVEKEPIPFSKIENVVVEKVSVSAPEDQPKINFSGGAFKKSYEKQNKDDNKVISGNVIGSVFKSTSGWQDGKYYCFNNEATAGTILKLTNKQSGKSIYAKVLDVIPDIKQNAGLQIIVSNAAAEELGVAEKFECEISL